MKKYIFSILVPFLLLIISLSIFARISVAQETSEDKAKKFGVAFPVAELGNCASVSECRTYCEDQTHKDACVSFAKKKGFYKEPEVDTKRQALIQSAKVELGCNSEESCKEICQQEANFEKCQSFAEKNGLETGQKNPGDKKVLEKAKEILGCDSPTSCKAICEQEANKDKCSEFAKQAGLEGGKRRVGPGGCDSEDSCKAYCEKNPDECKKFGGSPSSDDKNRKKGPGGCDSDESCKKYCAEHPDECGAGDKPNPEEQQRNITGGPPEDFCKTNPDECRKKEMEIKNRQQNINQETEKERKQFQPEERRFENKPPEIRRENEGANRPPENRVENISERRPPEEIKGASTEMTFFNQIVNFLFK